MGITGVWLSTVWLLDSYPRVRDSGLGSLLGQVLAVLLPMVGTYFVLWQVVGVFDVDSLCTAWTLRRIRTQEELC